MSLWPKTALITKKRSVPSTFGTVLGVNFDSESMEWSISNDKAMSLFEIIDSFLAKKTCSLKEVQKLHGKLANFAQAQEFMKGFRFNILALLNKFEGKSGRKIIPGAVKRDLVIWKKCVGESKKGLPLRELFGEPPLFPLTIISDAAGAALEWIEGKSVNKTKKDDRGVASVFYANKKILHTSLLTWPHALLNGAKTGKGAYFGTKSGTLEAVGLILPFLSYPSELKNQHVLLQVDNLGVVYGWEKKYCKNDPETSLLLRTLHVIEAFLPCKIYVQHVKRCSDTMSRLADSLSRRSTTSHENLQAIERGVIHRPAGALAEWLDHPFLDWSLPEKIVSDIARIIKI